MAGVAAIASIVSSAYGVYSSMQAAEQQEAAARETQRMGEMNAANIEKETREEARRTEMTQREVRARALAAEGAGGTARGGSKTQAILGMTEEHQRQLEWLQQAGKSRANIARMEGRAGRLTGEAQATGTRAAGITQAVGGLTQAGGFAKRAGWSWGF